MYTAPDKRFKVTFILRTLLHFIYEENIFKYIYIYILRPDQINLLLLGFAGRILGPAGKKLNQVKV